MKKQYIKPICTVVKMEILKPIAASGLIYSQWTPWRRNIHWDDDGVGGWTTNNSPYEENNGYPYMRSDNAERWNYPSGEWYFTLEIIDH